ncbi:MAG: M3 family metallopeptidase [Gemmatimonadota bacterium]
MAPGPDSPENPLLDHAFRIPFTRIRTEHVAPAVREALGRAREGIARMKRDDSAPTYANTVGRLDALLERLDRVVGLVGYLVAVRDSSELREAYERVNPEVAEFYATLASDGGLRDRIEAFAATTAEAEALEGVRRRHLEKLRRSFRRAGAHLPPERRRRVVELQVELARTRKRFAENVLDATNAFELVVTDPDRLRGLPDTALERARRDAERKGLDGWRFTLHSPSLRPFMRYADDRGLRREMYEAHRSRATEPERDNRPLVRRTLALRRALARALGYPDFADYQLEERMARTGAEARAFVRELRDRTASHFRREAAALEAFAREEIGYERLEPWDVAYLIERLRRARFELDDEELRPYFPLDAVLDGMFEIARRVFGIRVVPAANDEVWHPDVRFFEVRDADGTHLGSFYADFFPREDKRGGAWMDDLITGGPRPDGGGGFEPHLALLAANFTPPVERAQPSLLTHDEVQTLFHEFGHVLHHCLSRVEIPARAGTNVAWDFVELPSQIMENWTWRREALDLFARHWRTGERLPDELFERMLRARTFMGAYRQMRQLAFATVDLELHTAFDPDGDEDPIAFGTEAMRPFEPRPELADGRMLAAFTHVFSSSYAAGYYSYKWAEVLDADAFGRFEREGVFDAETGRAFVDAILSRGDAEDPRELFRRFMGRDPDPQALIRRELGEEAAQAA